MSKRDVDRRVAGAIKALTASKEDSIRALAEALDKIEAVDAKLVALNKTRNSLIAKADTQHEAAKASGWKVRELTNAGLCVPRPVTLAVGHDGTASTPPTRDTAKSPAAVVS
jgi:hypothetical protein